MGMMAFCILIMLCFMFGQKQKKIPMKTFLKDLALIVLVIILFVAVPLLFLAMVVKFF